MEKLKLTDYEKLFANIRNCVSKYEDSNLNERIIDMSLANGERLSYCVPEGKIAHLLGINTDYLRSTSCLKASNNSIDILKEFIKDVNTYSIVGKFNDGYLKHEQVFSSYLNDKISIFNEIIQPNIFQLEFLAKIDRNECHQNGQDVMNVDYFLCTKSENDDYLVLGLVKESNNYVPITSQLYTDINNLKEKFAPILENQELTFVSKICIKSQNDIYNFNLRNIYLKPSDKVNKVSQLIEYSKEFKSSANINGDYIYVTRNSNVVYESIKAIASLIKNKATIDNETIQDNSIFTNNAITELIEAYNNCLVSGVTDSTQQYSDLLNENDKLKRELQDLKDSISKLSTANKDLSDREEALKKEAEAYRSLLQKNDTDIQKVLTLYSKK